MRSGRASRHGAKCIQLPPAGLPSRSRRFAISIIARKQRPPTGLSCKSKRQCPLLACPAGTNDLKLDTSIQRHPPRLDCPTGTESPSQCRFPFIDSRTSTPRSICVATGRNAGKIQPQSRLSWSWRQPHVRCRTLHCSASR